MGFNQCKHNDSHPNQCTVQGCNNWNGLEPDAVESIFGRRSNSILAARMQRERPAEYARLRQIAMHEKHLIPMEHLPVSLRPQE
jgi:hypothetical protein